MVEAVPAMLAEEQWEALGQRLSGIEASLQVCAPACPIWPVFFEWHQQLHTLRISQAVWTGGGL